MEFAELQQRLADLYGIQVGPEMGRYIMRKLTAGAGTKLPVIGGNAKTGMPMRTLIDPAILQSKPAPAASSSPSLFPQ